MGFNEREARLVEMLADICDGRSKEAKAEACGYHPKTVYRILKRADVCERITARVKENVRADSARVYRALFDECDKGNVRACEAILRALGDISANVVTTNITTLSEARNEDFAARLRDRDAERREEYQRVGGAGVVKQDEKDEVQ